MLILYKMLTRAVYALAWPYARSRAAKGEQKWQDRLGISPAQGPAELWLHAASVGEVKVLANLYHYLKAHRPSLTTCVSVLTDAGFRTAGKEFPEDVQVRFLPADTVMAVSRALDKVQPRCLVIAETEIWPNLVAQAAGRDINVILVNGRMSAEGFGRYRMAGSLLRKTFRHYDRFFFKTAQDAERYRQFGVPSERFEIAGDMKFDTPLWPRSAGRREEIRFRLGAGESDFVIVAGSTRPGEEEKLLSVLRSLREDDPKTRLVLAPRHLERLDNVKQMCNTAGFEYTIYGEAQNGQPVVMVDKMGLLMDLYMAADAAFVGGTLVDIGGHNILEPVWAGTPVFFGPHLSNVRDAAEYVTEKNFGARVESADELVDALRGLRSGEMTFAEKTEHDLEGSATARAGDHILGKLDHA